MSAENPSLRAGSLRRRLRGAEIPAPNPVPWRKQRAAAAAMAPRTSPGLAVGTTVRVGRMVVDVDALCAFVILLPMLFIVQFGTLGAAVIAGVTPLYAFLRRRDLLRVLLTRSYLLLFPGLALCSFLWSWVAGETLKFAVELCVTVAAAVLIGSSRNQNAVIKSMALAFFIYAAAAILVGQHVGIGVSGPQAFSGLTNSKNLMADIAGGGLLVSVAAGLISLRQRAWPWVALCAIAAAAQMYALVGARSAGALLAVSVGLGVMCGLGPLCHAGRALRGWVTVMIALIVTVVSLNYRTLSAALIQFAADVFDKDPTLTGRTYLWYRAQDVLQQTPHLGIGYSAFWIQGNLDAEGLWRYAGITDRGGFNFHNTLVDVRVMLGWPGAFLLGVALLVGAALLVRRFVQDANMAVIFWLTVLLYITCRMPIETLGIQQFYHSTLLLFAALSAGLTRTASPGAPPAQRGLASRVDYTRLQAAQRLEVVQVGRSRIRTKASEPEPEVIDAEI